MNVGGTRSVLICRSNPPLIRSGVITPALLPGWTWCSGQDVSSRGCDGLRHWHNLEKNPDEFESTTEVSVGQR